MLGGMKGQLDCITQFSEIDYTEDLKKVDIPTLVIHGDDDQMVPVGPSSMQSSKILRNATFEVYVGAPHGLTITHRDQFNADMLAFAQSS